MHVSVLHKPAREKKNIFKAQTAHKRRAFIGKLNEKICHLTRQPYAWVSVNSTVPVPYSFYSGQHVHQEGALYPAHLKVLTNEKRAGLSVISFDRSPFKLFSLKFSNKIGAGPIL